MSHELAGDSEGKPSTSSIAAIVIDLFSTEHAVEMCADAIDGAIGGAAGRGGPMTAFALHAAMRGVLRHAPVPLAVDTNALYRQIAIAYSGCYDWPTFHENSN